LALRVPLALVTRPAMWGHIPTLCAEKVVAQTSKKRVRAKNLLGNHPQKRAHIRENTRILSPCMGFEARLPSVARSAQYQQSFCMKNRRKVHVSVHSSSTAHLNRRGAAPRAPIAAKMGSLDAPENYPHFAARRARGEPRGREWRDPAVAPVKRWRNPGPDALPCPTNPPPCAQRPACLWAQP